MTRYIALFTAFFAILFYCSDDSGTNAVEAKFSSIHSEIISVRCAKSGCHLDFKTPFMSVSSAQATYSALVNVVNPTTGLKYINPGFPDSSYLYIKILPDQDGLDLGRINDRMPKDGKTEGYLSSAQISAIRDWILDGAPNN